jgi:pre-mRNA-splicing factor CDC5/CEF1
MRILIKGGVWKNTEDEILKAAVMKYGKNQWARVASLLNRKSAKQCKARWYEWLDPSIKKTEWTREEEEKLLHLAKLMPNQWRTIAPIVGRTAGQCMEHYERLLDQAQEESAEPNADDPRRLRPGEIDPAPETKPARPDPVDMDEDELEMLAEARARLANTKGKKAKRKARERMLEESRRLSVLQKRRELKAAGIESRINMGGKKGKGINYASEIPFQKVVPAGFYDVSEEDHNAKQMHLDPKAYGLQLSKLEGQNNKAEEEKKRKRDANLMKKMFEENAPLAVMKVQEANDPVSLRRRVPLSLPAPQVTENEIEDIMKLNKLTSNNLMTIEGLNEGFKATDGLISDYASIMNQPMHQSTPLRTPQREDIIMQEAKNLRILREMTPLSTQDVPELLEGTGFQGVNPRRAVAMTPNSLIATSQVATGMTPSRSVNGGMTPSNQSVASMTPSLRDGLGLNSGIHDHSDTHSLMSMDWKSQKSNGVGLPPSFLRSQLSSLPEPEYTYEVAVPATQTVSVEDVDEDEDEEDGTDVGNRRKKRRMVEDAADVEERKRKERERLENIRLAKRSKVLQKGLPRPVMVDSRLSQPSLSKQSYPDELVAASALINEEMVRFILHEIKTYPPENVKAETLSLAYNIQIEDIDLEDLSYAESLIQQEMKVQLGDSLEDKLKEMIELLEKMHTDLLFVPTKQSTCDGEWKKPNNKAETLHALKSEFKLLEAHYNKEKKRLDKLVQKHTILTQGYLQRESSLETQLLDVVGSYHRYQQEIDNLKIIRDQEARAAEYRLLQLKKEAKEAEDAESESQQKYAELVKYARECGIEV